MELRKDTTERNLGFKEHKCRICGEKGDFQSYLVREMMQNTGDEFEYFVCSKCNCLQITEFPKNVKKYYGDNYYSFSVTDLDFGLFPEEQKNMTKILDVGCGSGEWLVQCAKKGYGNLYGCDPFINNDISYGDCIHIKKSSIHEVDGYNSFDIIRMGDSFEHVMDPYEVLDSARRLLKDGGMVEMCIPTYPNIAFDMFGPYWCQLDAPRHIFLHSLDSLKYLIEKCGFLLVSVEYDSDAGQIIGSYFYQHQVPFYDINEQLIEQYFSDEDRNELNKMSIEVNKKHYGDHMNVYLKKKV